MFKIFHNTPECKKSKCIYGFLLVVLLVINSIAIVFLYFKVSRIAEKANSSAFDMSEARRMLRLGNTLQMHIVQVGGMSSDLMTVETYGLEEGIGQYYLNPSNEYVDVSLTRGGDLLAVTLTDIMKEAGYKIQNNSTCNEGPDICHLPIKELRNEYSLRFIKS